jgi:hypothetical protein
MTLPHTYTRENLIRRLIRYSNALGRAPRTTDLQRFVGPNRNVICNVFGVKTWSEVLEAAGLTGMVVERKKPYDVVKREPLSREDVIAAYQEIIRTEGILPSQEEQKNLYKLRTKFFSSEEEVVTAAGFDYEFLRKMTDRVRRMRREGLKSAGYYEALISVYPGLAKYSREYIEKYTGELPVKGQMYERMGESRNPGPETISPAEHWRLWQEYYQKELYHTPAEGEPHEAMMAQAIMMFPSPEATYTKLTELSKKYPSSVGANAADEFRRLWVTTRTEVLPPRQRLEHPGHIQLVRPRKAG